MSRLHLFEGFGVELEYMVVDRTSHDVAPIADQVLMRAAGVASPISDLERGPIAWSNELVLHVLELKTNGPAPSLEALPALFLADVQAADAVAGGLGARLLPSAMHPWMDPARETRLWPHEYSPVYEAFDRIFGCSGHGWSNLQSAHLNLPFADEGELVALHAAIRLVLPLVPALAASSPYQEGQATGLLDTRLEHYRRNSQRIPSVAGLVIPEAIGSEVEYRRDILERIWADLAPHDPAGVLRDEFANARGAIARFERGAIEIRVVDVQETPRADLAILAALVELLRELVEQHHTALEHQHRIPTDALAVAFRAAIRDAERAELGEVPGWREALGLPAGTATGAAAWQHILDRLVARGRLAPLWEEPLEVILRHGPLARRMVAGAGLTPTRQALVTLGEELAGCLVGDRLLLP
jgi:gamma-glutamyl:cysteine ligase YbdK (ATP-grasp superfamily)